jgi:pimeloyl-ACP methyl ester carboxylesterase
MSEKDSAKRLPTVVLVHGAFADGSSWAGVIERLQARGIDVIAPANPLRGLTSDSAYIAGVFEQTPGPVVAVGHSYAGAVISSAARHAKNVIGLVFVAAFATEEGERLGEVTPTSKDAILGSALASRHYPSTNGGEPVVEFTVDPAKFHEVFAADLSEAEAAVLAAAQRPVAELAFSDPAGSPAWKHLRSWAVVATEDKAAGTDLTRSHAERAGAMITEVDASHVVMVSQPDAVTEVILQAVVVTSSHGDQSWAEALFEAYIND